VDLPILSKSQSLFREIGTEVVISSYETCLIANDKWKTYQFLSSHGFSVPKTYLNLSDFRLDMQRGEIDFPVLIKPRWGMGSMSIYEVDSDVELEVLHNKSKNSIWKSYLKYESRQDIQNPIIIQEKIQGEEIGLDILCDLEGNYLHGVPLRVLEMRSGESHLVESVEDERLLELGRTISKLLIFRGCWNIDVLVCDYRYYILEINCRFNGLSPFSYLAGANYPKLIINMLRGLSLDKTLLRSQVGIQMCKTLHPQRVARY